MSTHHQLMLHQASLLNQNGYSQLTASTPFLQYLEYQLDMVVHDAHKQQRPQTFNLVANTHLESFGKLFLTFHYSYDPFKNCLDVNSIDAFMGQAARRFIPLEKDHLPAPHAIAAYLVNAKKLKTRQWAKEFRAMPMLMVPGTHKKRRTL